jgi:hypothetical protein
MCSSMLDETAGSMLECRMLSKERVLKHFGSVSAIAQFFGISDKAVYQWDDGAIPRERELELMLRLPAEFAAPESRREEARA